MSVSAIEAVAKLFFPRSIAVVGASGNPRNLGSRSLGLIKKFGYQGKLFAVNPRGEQSQGVTGYTDLTAIPEEIDLALIVVPVKTVAAVVAACVQKDVPVAQILTSGFAEAGDAGRDIERLIVEQAAGRTRLVGPNCLGVYSPRAGISFVATAGRTPGRVAVASQSGGLSVDMLLQAKARGLDLGKLVSIGNCADLDPVDFLTYFGQDPDIELIGFYLEGIKRGPQFVEALREVAAHKPVVILKGGRTSLGAASVASHTNSLAGEYAIWRAAMAQCGAILAEDVDRFLAVLTAMQSHVPRPRGRGLALVGNGGGATVLATDLMEERGMTLARPAKATQKRLGELKMPAGSSVGNPTDTPVGALNKAGAQALGGVVNILLADPEVSAAVVHFNLLPFINYDNRVEIAEGVSAALEEVSSGDKPVYVALRSVPDPPLEELRQSILATLRKNKLPCFSSASEAVEAAATVQAWTSRRQDRVEGAAPTYPPTRLDEARGLLHKYQSQGYRALPQEAAFQLLDWFGIEHPPVRLATSAEQAGQIATELGLPVALKVESPDILHKTEAQGVRLGLEDARAAAQAYEDIAASARQYQPGARIEGVLVQAMAASPLQELICGLKRDPVFGPVVILGLGGVLVEILRDVSMRLAPLGPGEAGAMWRELAGARLLTGYRGRPPADTSAVEALLYQVAQMGASLPEIGEMDLNPVMVGPQGAGLSVVDCRVLLTRALDKPPVRGYL